MTIRRFAACNVIFWALQHPVTVVWYLHDRAAFGNTAQFYLVQISIAALWLSSLAWWGSSRAEQAVRES